METTTTPPAQRAIGSLMAGLMLTVFLAMLDQQIVATALPKIVGELDALADFAWITTGYIIGASVTAPLYGKLGDLFGRKKILLIAITIFLIGSLGCGIAQSMDQLIGFRIVQGTGAGGLFVSVMATIAELFDPRERMRQQGRFTVLLAVSAIAGPAVGGVITDHLGWRWVFYVNLPLGLLAIVAIARYLNLPDQRRHPHIDYLGAALLSGAIIALALLTSWGGTTYPWGSPTIIGLGVATVVLLLAFCFVEQRAKEPIIPLRLFADRTFTLSNAVAIAGGAVFLGMVNFLALFVQNVTGADATTSGLVLLPMMLGLVAGNLFSVKMIMRTNSYHWFPAASMALGIGAALLLSTMDTDTSRFTAGAYMVLLGIASGLSMQVLTTASLNTVPLRDMGAAAGTTGFTKQFGVSIGLSVFATVLNTQLAGDTSRAAYADALTTVFWWTVPVLAVGLACALFLPNLPLRAKPSAAKQPAQNGAK